MGPAVMSAIARHFAGGRWNRAWSGLGIRSEGVLMGLLFRVGCGLSEEVPYQSPDDGNDSDQHERWQEAHHERRHALHTRFPCRFFADSPRLRGGVGGMRTQGVT